MTKLAGILLAFLIAASLVGCVHADGSTSTPPRLSRADEKAMARLERIVRERVDGKRSTGIVAGVVFPNGRTRVVAYGDAGAGRRLDASSLFEIGSITKVFTTTLLAEMVERGEVKLTDPVARFLPARVRVPARGRQIRLVDLATHTSGLPRLPTNFKPEDPANPYADYTVEQLYTFLSGYTLTRAVGSKYEYSNLGVGLLGHVLALRAGTSYEQLLRERVLEPLGMTTTAIALTPELERRFASGHDARGEVVPHWDIPTLAGAGALRSTATDMLRFAAANLDRDDGPLARALAATHASRRTIGPQLRIGLGWHILRPFDRELVWHDGGTAGFSSFIGLDKTRRLAIVVLSNSTASTVDDIGLHFLDKRVPLTPPPKVRKAIALPRAVLERYVGVYQLPGLRVRITLTPKGLVAQPEGQPAARLYAETETEFFLKVVDARVTFRRGPGGAVTGLVLHQDGASVPARRIR